MKILFTHLPRTAGTFIREYCEKTGYMTYSKNEQDGGHLPLRIRKDLKEWFRFGIVRNPFDWYVSQYFWFIEKGTKYGKKRNFAVIEEGIFKNVDGGVFGKEFVAKFPTFKDWFNYGKKLDNFWFSYIYKYMFCNEAGTLLLNYVGKFENLNDEIDLVLKINDIEEKIKFSKFEGDRNASKHNHYSTYYTNDMKEKILEKDADILNKYGYIQ